MSFNICVTRKFHALRQRLKASIVALIGGDMSETRGLIDAIDALWGGAFTTAVAAIAGRLMWHSTEVRSGRRRFFGRELLWELPIAIGMAIIGESVASYFGLDRKVSTGVVAAFAYLGPRGAEAVLTRMFSNTKG